jgi:hypothetical protein
VDVWEKAVRNLHAREMPPPGAPRPDAPTLDATVAWLERALDAHALANPKPGRVAVHRLNRAEYTNAIRDLLALELDPRALLLSDEPDQQSFDNLASVLSVSPALLENYLSAAYRVTAWRGRSEDVAGGGHLHGALGDGPGPAGERRPALRFAGRRSPSSITFPPTAITPSASRCAVSSISTSSAWASRTTSTSAWMARAWPGSRWAAAPGGAPCRRALPATRRAIRKFEVYMHTADANLTVRVPVTAGIHDVGVSFVRRYWAGEGVLQPPQRGFARTTNELLSRQPAWTRLPLRSLSHAASAAVVGVPPARAGRPRCPSRWQTGARVPSRKKVFICRPASRAQEEPCARRILSTLATRAYRRPVTAADMATLLEFYRGGRARGDFEIGIQQGIERILAAPSFIFRVVRAPRVGGVGPTLPPQRSRPRVASLVLPLEQHPG